MSEHENNNKLPDSWLYSENFLKRAFAVWGHNFVAQLIISVVVFAVMMIVFSLFSASVMQ